MLAHSAMDGGGLSDVWAQVVRHRDTLDACGELAAKRRRQQVDWTWAMVHDRPLAELHADPRVAALVPDLERRVRDGTLTPALAVDEILAAYRSKLCRYGEAVFSRARPWSVGISWFEVYLSIWVIIEVEEVETGLL